jgi:hypothetical protein
LLSSAIGWAAANWILDAASLWVFVLATEAASTSTPCWSPTDLANVLAAIPLTARGLGVVEAVLTSLARGVRLASRRGAVGGDLLAPGELLAPHPGGGLAYVSLRAEAGHLREGVVRNSPAWRPIRH